MIPLAVKQGRIFAMRTHDAELVQRVLLTPEIFATVAEDGADPATYAPNMNGEAWLAMCTEALECVGVYNLHWTTAATLQIHAHVLPEARAEYSRDTGLAALAWILENTPAAKVEAHVPVLYPNVANFCKGFGFQLEGTSRQSYLKNGNPVDVLLLGITRTEIEALFSNVQDIRRHG